MAIAFESASDILCKQALDSTNGRHNEAELRSDMHIPISQLCEQCEIPMNLIRMEGTNTAGRFDSLYGNILIEWKRPRLISNSTSEKAKAARQALSYLDDPRYSHCSIVVSDGYTWGFYRSEELPGATQLTLDIFSQNTTQPLPIERFSWRTISIDTMNYLVSLFESSRAMPPTSENISSCLGLSSTLSIDYVQELIESLAISDERSRAATLFSQWRLTAGVAYGVDAIEANSQTQNSNQELRDGLRAILPVAFENQRSTAEILFCLQTYVALISKLIACEIIAGRNGRHDCMPSRLIHRKRHEIEEFMQKMESGEISRELSIPTVIEGNVFDWYAYLPSDKLFACLHGLLCDFSRISWISLGNTLGLTIDILRDLYHSIVPRILRRFLGEFFTPTWLAEYSYLRALSAWENTSESKDPITAEVLDPTCGSGTFLLVVISDKLRRIASMREITTSDVDMILQKVVGIDINPISCLMARINILLGLGDSLRLASRTEVRIYEADSLLRPSVQLGMVQTSLLDIASNNTSTNLPVVQVFTALPDPFLIPAAYLDQTVLLPKLRQRLEGLLQTEVDADYSEVKTLAVDGVLGEDAQDSDILAQSIFELYTRLRNLKREGRDDVWIRMIEDYMAPSMCKDFDIIVGNPPWISWENLPSSWKERAKSTLESFGIWQTTVGRRNTSRQSMSRPRADIASMVFIRCLASYLSPDGVCALVVPQSLLIGESGQVPFRRCHARQVAMRTGEHENINQPYQILFADDFTTINPFAPDASNKTFLLAATRTREAPSSVEFSGYVWSRSMARQAVPAISSWRVVSPLLSSREVVFRPVSRNRVESPWACDLPQSISLRDDTELLPYEFGHGWNTRGQTGMFIWRPQEGALPRNHHIRMKNCNSLSRPNSPEIVADIPTAILRPVIKGSRAIKPWSYDTDNLYLLFAYEWLSSSNTLRGLNDQDLQREFGDFWINVVRRHLQLYQSRRFQHNGYQARDMRQSLRLEINADDSIYGDNACYVAIPEMNSGDLSACVVKSCLDSVLGQEVLPIPTHKVNLFIGSEDICYYLCAFMNCKTTREIITAFTSSIGLTPTSLRRLPIPEFSVSNPSHQEVVRISRQLHVEYSMEAEDLCSSKCGELMAECSLSLSR